MKILFEKYCNVNSGGSCNLHSSASSIGARNSEALEAVDELRTFISNSTLSKKVGVMRGMRSGIDPF